MFWPGSVVIGGGGKFSYAGQPLISNIVDLAGTTKPDVTSPSVVNAQRDSWNQALGGTVTLLDETAGPFVSTFNNSQTKGRIIIEAPTTVQSGGVPVASQVSTKEYLTLNDCNPAKTTANSNKRPSWDACDTYIGNDQASAALNATSLALGAPSFIRTYINNVPDGFSWLTQVTSSFEEHRLPTQFDAPVNALVGCTGCSPYNLTSPQVSDNFNRSAGPLGSNWTTLEGTWAIYPGPHTGAAGAFFPTNYAAFTALNGSSRASTYFSGVSFPADQFIQATMTGANSIIGICVRMANAAPLTAYCLGTGSNQTVIYKYISGAVSVIYTDPGGQVPNSSTVKLAVQGSNISYYLNGVLKTTVSDSSITSGSLGMLGLNLVTPNNQVDDIYGGSYQWTGIILTSQLTPQPFSALVGCSTSTEGTQAAVNNSTVNTWGTTITGGGTNHVLAYCDGTTWTVAGK
jgi:hypothetical protein